MTSRYLRFKAEQVTITPVAVGDSARAATAASLREMSQSHRSTSVKGIFWDIFCLFDAG